ncbi:MAG: DUF2961 domain-containing protein [Phycisphaeraceae bacterium]|nr:DUF2961 domain-containing protein [Phycisphaeraceae bacterium]
MAFDLSSIGRITTGRTRSISAENPTGAPGAGARAAPGSDAHCTPASRDLGVGWKVRPCLRNLAPGSVTTIADIAGPAAITHVWMTVHHRFHRALTLRVTYDDSAAPSIDVPLGDFFANGVDGRALVNSLPVCVNPSGGLNSYWPLAFRGRARVEVVNDGHEAVPELFFQVSYEERDLHEGEAYLHACWRRARATRERPEHVVLERAAGPGHYVGTYLVWGQRSSGWWGEGEVKFFIDDDSANGPTICGTGTEDYFGGAWGFVTEPERSMRPTTYSTAFLGYPQALCDPDTRLGPRPPVHGLYRWHVPDPIRFSRALRVTVQALGWWPDGRYQPLEDDLASTALWYASRPAAVEPALGGEARFPS